MNILDKYTLVRIPIIIKEVIKSDYKNVDLFYCSEELRKRILNSFIISLMIKVKSKNSFYVYVKSKSTTYIYSVSDYGETIERLE